MTQRVVLASSNKGKVREFSELLSGRGMAVVPQSDFAVPDADETGLTFVENAIIKARNAAAHTGLPAIADDSGLEVDYLNGYVRRTPEIIRSENGSVEEKLVPDEAKRARAEADSRALRDRIRAELDADAEADG